MFSLPVRAAALLSLVSLLCLPGTSYAAQTEDQLPTSTSSIESSGTPATFEMQGDLLVARGNYAAAVRAYQQASPQTAVIWNKTGVAYHHLFALDEALKDYKEALTLDPHYATAYNNLGAVYHGKNQFALAEKAYKHAIKYQPRAAVSYCNLGTTYFAEGKYKKGVKAYHQAMEIDPSVFAPSQRDQVETVSSRQQRMSMAFYLAETYASSGKMDEALASLRKAFSYGFKDRKRLMEDKQLAALRSTPEFHVLMVEQQLE